MARVDVGFGNALFIRGEGAGLSWDKGVPLECVSPSTWAWRSGSARKEIVFKLLVNDEVWSRGDNMAVRAGHCLEVTPAF